MADIDEINLSEIEQVADYFLTPQKFDEIIEELVWEIDCNHLEAVVEYCKRLDIDTLDVAKLISKPLKEKIEFDAYSAGMLKRDGQLPV